ncbi:MAG: cupin domain-containing protein [Sneathiellaceae bacterium]
MTAANLFAATVRSDSELVEELAGRPGLRIERIVSQGQASPPGFWYDQAEDEWVALLSGAARLEFADGRVREMAAGDHVLLPAGLRHRVAWTDPGRQSVWLAVFWDPVGSAPG